MKPPRTIDVGPYRLEVVVSETAIDRKSIERGAELIGRFEGDSQKITLSPNLAFDMLRETLLHEILHGLLMPLELDDKEEERIILTLSPSLLDLFRRNPKLIRFILEERP